MTLDCPASDSASSDVLPELTPGSLLRDIYHVDCLLGAGAHGAVYRVRHRFLGIQALKLLHPQRNADLDQRLSEARVLAGLTHPRVVRVFDANILDLPEGSFPYFTMEYLPCGTLADLLHQRLRLEITESLSVAAQILDGVAAVHALDPPLLHRDLIPGNVLVVDNEKLAVKVGDFGVASQAHPITGVARAAGVINYLPPEAMWGYATTSGDLYAIALILYSMVTGAAAFPIPSRNDVHRASDLMQTILSPRLRPPARPSRFRSEVRPGLDGLLVKALSPEPTQRFGSAREFADAVQALLKFEDTA